MLIKGEYGTAVIHAAIVDDTTKEQVKELMNQKFVMDLNVRIMPDCHAGKGCVIGTTMNVVNSCVPNLVGVDIGCGMFTVELGKMNINLEQLDNYIKENIPFGENIYEENQEYNTNIRLMECYDKLKHKKRFDRSIGTLGGGNHFIEIDKDEDDNLYLIIHSGSRNLGVQVCEHYMDVAENNLKHKVSLTNKKDLLIEGVKTIDSFDSNEFLVETIMGYMHIEGKGLMLGKMDNDNEELTIKGEINKLEYVNSNKDKEKSFLKKIFK